MDREDSINWFCPRLTHIDTLSLTINRLKNLLLACHTPVPIVEFLRDPLRGHRRVELFSSGRSLVEEYHERDVKI